MEKFEIVYTRSSKCVLDIGLNLLGGDTFTCVAARASSYSKKPMYGASARSDWYRTGVYCSEEEWEWFTKDKSTEYVCNVFRLRYWFNDNPEEFDKQKQKRTAEKERRNLKMASKKVEYLEFVCDICKRTEQTSIYTSKPDKWERVCIGTDIKYDMCEECVNKVVDYIRCLRNDGN